MRAVAFYDGVMIVRLISKSHRGLPNSHILSQVRSLYLVMFPCCIVAYSLHNLSLLSYVFIDKTQHTRAQGAGDPVPAATIAYARIVFSARAVANASFWFSG